MINQLTGTMGKKFQHCCPNNLQFTQQLTVAKQTVICQKLRGPLKSHFPTLIDLTPLNQDRNITNCSHGKEYGVNHDNKTALMQSHLYLYRASSLTNLLKVYRNQNKKST